MINEWENEPDYLEFEEMNYKCEIKRIPQLLHLCGYVHIPANHFLYNKNCIPGFILKVHGGITFHTDNILGFDCGHPGDFIPALTDRILWVGFDYTYKNIEYVKKECQRLVFQLQRFEEIDAILAVYEEADLDDKNLFEEFIINNMTDSHTAHFSSMKKQFFKLIMGITNG